MKIFVYFKRRKENGIFLPNFEVHRTEPQVDESEKKRVHALEDGECIYGGRFYWSADQTYINCYHYRVSNLNGHIKEDMLEAYTLPKYGN